MLKKLQIKFVCINMVIVTVMMAVIFGMVFYFTGKSLEAESLQMMQSLSTGPIAPGLPGENMGEIRLPYFILHINHWGDVTGYSSGYYDLSDEEFLAEITKVVFSSQAQSGILKDYHLRYLRSVGPSGERLIFVDTSSEEATMRSLISSCAAVGALCLVIFFGISLLFARWSIKPVAQAWEQQKQFVADASHELKTPLTVIMTNAELLQSSDYGEDSKQKFAGSILTMSHQMRGLVEGLLELARVDNGAAKAKFAELDYSQLVSDALLPFEPLFFERGLQLESQLQNGIRLSGSESHLRQVVEILLDNALKYSSADAAIRIRLFQQGNQSMLTVSNPGDPISKEDLKNIFKRFYRIDSVRTMNHSYGLGLSIAASIVTSHHGKIWAESRGGMITFFVQLPI